ncbi:DUF1501 domain-containing protein [uncultured Arcticibacterium sp.]|uniref:DUF1501 domain-containing protein n=1 Tax=uncultured Arcticibacterium sp. TaxID=2173042 RepID=UPI0030F919F8
MERRKFIKHIMAGGVAPYFLNGLPINAFGGINETALGDDKVLVVIQMAGGNDGLNTVVPIDQYANYSSNRGAIALKENRLLSIPQSDKIGLHPSLSPLTELFEEGKANIIQDVGYPDPDFSHFRSTDIWNTASDSDKQVLSGWAGRYLASDNPDFPNNYPNEQHPDPLSIQIGSVLNTSLQGPVYPMGMAISGPDFFYELLTEEQGETPTTLAEKELAYLRQVATQTNQYANSIKKAATAVGTQVTYNQESLSQQLKVVARLIAGGLRTKFYFVRIGGFDTHDNQAETSDTSTGEHANLLAELSNAILSFTRDLEQLGAQDRVLTMTYSEFGRRIKANGSRGTDHGAAAPMFLFGEFVNSKVFGENPILPTVAGNNESVPMQFDFRSVYASILERWFCVETPQISEVMLQTFQSLPLVQGAPCGFITANAIPEEIEIPFKAYPNPVIDFVKLEFLSDGGINLIQIFNARGQVIATPLYAQKKPGWHTEIYNAARFASGSYFVRWQNNAEQKIIKLIRV